MKLQKRLIAFLLFVLLATLTFALIQKTQHPNSSGGYEINRIQVADHTLDVYIADTNNKREIGLAVFDEISEQQGMLFVFDTVDRQIFWMKNMKFDIDIIWINGQEIVDITKNVPVQNGASDSELFRYRPRSEVDKVLEVKAGWVDKFDISIGENISM
ncbi:MAG: hypothetical protein BWY19_00885 [bacterium ADurb.Bin212]|nr:MAG: hypothetical protein BWY19_00885 [bacterium ADurb.Bin212]